MAKDNRNKNLPDSEYPASASEPSGLFGLFGKRKPKIDPAAMNGVYAGPDQMNSRPPMGRVYAGPDQMNKRTPMAPVYAGPAQPNSIDPPPAMLDAARQAADNTSVTMLVYAGPAQMSNFPPMPMQTVYAGPEFFNGPKPGIPAGAAGPFNPNAQPTPSVPSAFKDYDGPLVTCQVCGHSAPAGMKFCPECGSPFPREDKTEQC